MASYQSTRSILRPVKTCTQCKQVKLRCDSKEKFPAPCTRCQMRGFQCVVDSSFRRTPARQRVEDMAKELKALKSQKQEDLSQRLTKSPSRPDSAENGSSHPSEHPGTASLDETGLTQEYYHLEEFVVDKATIVEIYKIFCAFYYPHFPILNHHISIANLHDFSPLLFWTIVAITTCRAVLPIHEELFESLREPFLRCFRSGILEAPLPIQIIQAIAYLVTFPLPQRKQIHDPSWLYCGIAINAAMYMGLHHAKPGQSLRSIGVPSGSPRVRAHTWLGCFLASTSLAKHTGISFHLTSNDLTTIEELVRHFPLPAEFTYQIMVHHTLAKFFATVAESSQESMSYSLVKIIDAELDGIQTRYSTPWTPRAEFACMTAKMLLYTSVIIRLRSDRASREILMRNGLSVALKIVYLLDKGLAFLSSDFPHVPPENVHGTLPKNYFRILVLATTFLLRFFVLNDKATPEEQELARNHVAITQRLLSTGSKSDRDEKARGAVLFEILSRQKPIDLDSSKLRVDDRQGASLYYDAVSTGHQLRQLPVEVEEPLSSAVDEGTSESPEPASDLNGQDEPMDDTNLNEFLDLNFSLPEDIWGDSVWGIFDNIVPATFSAYPAPKAI